MFEQATRLKVRFDYKGSSTVEDLWDMPLEHLDELFKGLNAELKDQKGESLLQVQNTGTALLELKIGLIKHVVGIRLVEQDKRKAAAENREKKQRILEIIADKQNEELKGKSIEELTSLVNDM